MLVYEAGTIGVMNLLSLVSSAYCRYSPCYRDKRGIVHLEIPHHVQLTNLILCNDHGTQDFAVLRKSKIFRPELGSGRRRFAATMMYSAESRGYRQRVFRVFDKIYVYITGRTR